MAIKWVARFAARSGDRRSAIWRCFQSSEDGDIYLGTRSTLSAIKASLHASGRWHTAFDQKYFSRKRDEGFLEGEARWLMRWERPESPIAVALRVVMPSVSVTVPVQAGEDRMDVVWLRAPPAPQGVHVAFVLVRPDVPDTGMLEGGLFSKTLLPSGDRLLLVQAAGPIPKLTSSTRPVIRPLLSDMPDLPSIAARGTLRVIVPGQTDDGVPLFLDVAVAASGSDAL